MIYAFDGFELDTDRRELRHGVELVRVEPQVFDVLTVLVGARERLVTKNDLLDVVWHTQFVTESALTSRIKAARRAIGDDGASQRLIKTVHGHGYRFVGQVVERSASPARAREVRGVPEQRVQFCRAPDGVRLAYAVSGEGPPLVKAANWLTHLRYDWESPVWRHWLSAFGARHRFVHYDERGSGMSDWDVDDLSFDAWVSDLETVVDASGVDTFDLLALSQGGAVAIEYAVRHPERVKHLVLYGAFAVGRAARAQGEAEAREAEMMLRLVQVAWGRGDSQLRHVFPAQFMPSATPAQWDAFNEHQVRTATPENALRLLQTADRIDVTEVASRVRAPTLVLHASGDRRVPFEQSELLASLIPGAQLLALDSDNHVLTEHEPAWPAFLEAVESFLATD